MQNNKKLGSDFEKEMCDYLRRKGFWVHFLSPDARGAQPFDIIAVKMRNAVVMDCKTAVKPIFPISRLEDNQLLAFEMWMKRGNGSPFVAIKYENEAFLVPYTLLKDCKKIDLREKMHSMYVLKDFKQ